MSHLASEQYQPHPNVKWRAMEIPQAAGAVPSGAAGSADQRKRPVVKSRKRR